MDRETVRAWVAAYERAWRTPGTDALAELFAADTRYVVSPWANPIVGRTALAEFWEAGRDGPDEQFTMISDLVAVDGDTAVVRIQVEYERDDPARWRDLWIIRFDDSGRCVHFEEWPFAPGQPDGH